MGDSAQLNAALTEMWDSGMTAEEIAEQLGISVNAVYKRRQRLMLERHKSGYRSFIEDPATRKWFIRNYPDLSNRTISIFLGISADHIRKVALRLGLRKSKEYVSGARRGGIEDRTRDSNGKFTKRETV